jgi:hypothetical protein
MHLMASPISVSTPSSAGSPANIAPAPQALAMKPVNSVPNVMLLPTNNPDAHPISLGPRKEWIIPPRPKPGRKPATDTPPTKRKAQNRAAQRAFRERRAARVGELEEQLKETEEERQKREATMQEELTAARSEITRLEADLRRFIDEAIEWRQQYNQSEELLAAEKREKDILVTELAYLRNGARSTGTNAVALPPRRNRAPKPKQIVVPQNLSAPVISEPLGCGGCTSTGSCICVEQAMEIATSGCGNCSPDSHCECLEETLRDAAMTQPVDVELKRAHSPRPANLSKRPRLSIEDMSPQEIDFTSQFSTKPPSHRQNSSQDFLSSTTVARPPPGESCGFCDEGTYCACAEAAAATEREREMENRLPPLMNEVTPPPSDSDVTTSDNIKLPSLLPNFRLHHSMNQDSQPAISSLSRPSSRAADSCINGPGTCRQCQEDPKSGLFCRSLAAMRASDPSSAPSGCCGSAGPGGCCKTQNQPQPEASKLTLSCADAYKTLASHRNFDRASDELANWLPKLNTIAPRYPDRAAMDIDAASVMSVIKYFDVRFGRE